MYSQQPLKERRLFGQLFCFKKKQLQNMEIKISKRSLGVYTWSLGLSFGSITVIFMKTSTLRIHPRWVPTPYMSPQRPPSHRPSFFQPYYHPNHRHWESTRKGGSRSWSIQILPSWERRTTQPRTHTGRLSYLKIQSINFLKICITHIFPGHH